MDDMQHCPRYMSEGYVLQFVGGCNEVIHIYFNEGQREERQWTTRGGIGTKH